ncbi:MAG: 50S ribosomal protein L28 [Candidatus Levybacteria bacterium RIFCSPLOWO2_02_FULL_37_10]|nr:MAG: 50S ribosomal protein L28 [Candidatus Levybacteria bacterium RIFCSPHIGHO2_01_FULL_37_33]OGH16309.1 MAG: 50S ribosomal protein L28 [Candidatus Levybacteria bacterium RIFCSPHIGHO2_02_FULL_37_11]OGH32540.1 MAG: 50S ribosomal protein L28 [Candidatus Levybacteria bacterium RIFCSPLOWO2_01_FULL_36_54]OGH43399.1 MAG: 50S ribosomal protein L28 [Candidatus Levybacteria bacterium RIFCSPLOWO2_02_FULL_37_10]
MAMKCENCGKGIMYGHNVSHSKRRTRRIFKPNLHKAKVVVGGISKRMKLCSKCLRLLKGKSTRDIKKRELTEKISSAEAQPSVAAV